MMLKGLEIKKPLEIEEEYVGCPHGHNNAI